MALATEFAGQLITVAMVRDRWDNPRDEAVTGAVATGNQVLAGLISQFLYREGRPEAVLRVTDVEQASL